MKSVSSKRRGILRRHFSYANVMATVAVFMALSGVAWAASLPKNSVGSKQIRKDAVRSAEIKRAAVSTSEVKNNSLSGVDINEALLGKVPLAGTADSVTTDISITKRIQSSASAATPAAARAAATEVPLFSHGQLTFYAKCFIDTTANDLYGEILVRTSANGGLALSTETSLVGDPAYLDTTTPEADRIVDGYSIPNDDADYAGDDRAAVIGPDGHGVHLQISNWLRHGTIAGSSPLSAGSDQCYFVITGSKVNPPS